MELQKRSWDVHMSNRVSRAASRASNAANAVAERAKSYEKRTTQQTNTMTSLPGSRRGSFSSGLKRSPSWIIKADGSRPPSRTDQETRRWASVGRLDVTPWEERIRKQQHTPSPSVARRMRDQQCQQQQHQDGRVQQQQQHDRSKMNKADLIEQWVRQASESQSSNSGQDQEEDFMKAEASRVCVQGRSQDATRLSEIVCTIRFLIHTSKYAGRSGQANLMLSRIQFPI